MKMKLFTIGIYIACIALLATACLFYRYENGNDLIPIATTTTPNLNIHYQYFVTDQAGKLTFRSKFIQAHSFTMTMDDILYVEYAYSGLSGQDYDTSGSILNFASGGYMNGVNAASGTDTYGIVIGSGTNTVSVTDYQLQTKILTGSTSGKMAYQACTVGVPQTANGSRSFVISRQFNNSSGSSITVNEVGVYIKWYQSSTSYYFQIIRDNIAGGQAVANGHNLTVQYTVSVTP